MTKITNHLHTYRDARGKWRCHYKPPGIKGVGLAKGFPTRPAIDAFLRTPEFLERYYAALKGCALPAMGAGAERSAAGTFNAVIASYFAGSPDWKKLSPDSKKNYLPNLEFLRSEIGTAQVAAIRRRQLIDLLNDKAETPGVRDALLVVMRKIIGWAIHLELRDDDPTVKIAKLGSNNPDGELEWPIELIERYRRHHSDFASPARAALEIGFRTGLRVSDACLFGRQNLRPDGKSFLIVPWKTRKFGTKVIQPIDFPSELATVIEAAPVRGQRAFLQTVTGRDFTKGTLGKAFAKWCKEASIPDEYRFHGLRKACAVRMSLAGCTDQQIMDWIGDRDPKMVQLYTKGRSVEEMSKNANAKLAAARQASS